MEMHKSIIPVDWAQSVIVFLHPHRMDENIEIASVSLYLHPGVEGLFCCQQLCADNFSAYCVS